MSVKKGSRFSEEAEELARVPLQAILLADSFTQKFRPITLERPKVLLPLVNIPMIDYALAWLESAGVEEIFVFCCAHSKQVIDYLEKSQWLCQPNFSVNTIESHNSTSSGDALRLIYERNVIHGDFVLISGDTVSNMSLTQALQEHKMRRKSDPLAVMTMVIKQSKLSSITHQNRLGTDELVMAIDPETNQLLYYEDKVDHSKGMFSLDKSLFSDSHSISVHNDRQDCYIDICSPEVLSLFTDNFDYQHLRRHFVKGLLVDDVMGYKIYTHEIRSSYAARVDNFRSYDTVSKDIIERWTYPLVPDVQFYGNYPLVRLERQGTYRASDVMQSRTAQVGPFSVVGSGTFIGDNSNIVNSVIGHGCTIGNKVLIEGSYIWNNVTIQDNCTVKHAIVCDGVIIKSGAILEPGVILSFKVIVAPQFVVPSYSKVSLLPQPSNEDSDEELECADGGGGIIESPTITGVQNSEGELTESPKATSWGQSEVGTTGAGFIWSLYEGGNEEEWRHSVAPIPPEKLEKLLKNNNNLDLNQDGIIPTTSKELTLESDISGTDEDDNEYYRGDSMDFEREVEATFLRAVHEVPGVDQENVILEVNSLRLSYNMSSADCAGAIFYSVMKLALEASHATNSELLQNAKATITTWRDLLKHYLKSTDEEIEVIMKFEEMCLESTKEFTALFSHILHVLYEEEVITEDAILTWAEEKEGADESDKIFVKQTHLFIQWLKETAEED